MTALCVRGRAIQGALHWLLAGLLLAAFASHAFAADPISVHVDEAKILKLPDRAATVVIGNPLIADLSMQAGGLTVVTGKGYGTTNMIVLDKGGAVLMEKTLEVKGPDEPTVVVYRGLTRQTYSCAPDCEPRITLGDTAKTDIDGETQLPADYFDRTLNQSVTRSNQAMSAGAGAAH